MSFADILTRLRTLVHHALIGKQPIMHVQPRDLKELLDDHARLDSVHRLHYPAHVLELADAAQAVLTWLPGPASSVHTRVDAAHLEYALWLCGRDVRPKRAQDDQATPPTAAQVARWQFEHHYGQQMDRWPIGDHTWVREPATNPATSDNWVLWHNNTAIRGANRFEQEMLESFRNFRITRGI